MPLPKHPKLMSDDELCDWTKSLIERCAPESSTLDYKAEISINGKTNRIELGKDVSSFANEGGGILLYGVPETVENGVPIPKNLSECGIIIPEEMPTNIENILIAVVEPPLPELNIRVLNLKELNQKSLLMIYHPESWNKPHMIEGYNHARYYRRGNFRSIIMNERQVETAYLSRKASLYHADNFFKTGDFRTIPEEGRFLRVIVCPRFPLIRKEEMLEERFKNWLINNTPNKRIGDWIPFLDGWRFRGHPLGNFHGKQYEFCLFHNGAVCFNMDLDRVIDSQTGYLRLDIIGKDFFKDMAFLYANKVFEFFRISGPLSIQVSLHNVKTLNAEIPYDVWFADTDLGPTPIEKDKISFIEETSVDELKFNIDNVTKRLIRRLASVFGIWQE